MCCNIIFDIYLIKCLIFVEYIILKLHARNTYNFFNFTHIFLVAPSPPIGPLEAFDVDRNAISIKWKPPTDDGGSPLIGYIVEKREASRSIWSKIDNVDAKTTQLRCKNLIEKTEYFFRVIAINAIGASQPLQADETTLARSRFSEYY